jgi:alginate O-acetyltransferase complex protein AlgI
MLFNSLHFLAFFILVTIAFFFLRNKYRWALLLAASCYFYMVFVPYYILILAATIIIDYFAGILIENSTVQSKRKFWLVLSLITNIGILCFFKYFNFFNENLEALCNMMNIKDPIPFLRIVLPIGLSFHTFQAMSYTIEVYKGRFKAERHFGIYALYVMFYPQLVAGPIERPQNVLPQFRRFADFDAGRVISGLRLMAWGLLKKVVIADRMTQLVDHFYDKPEQYQGIGLLVATYFFTIQIYCDFSGYTDMAIGAARVMGIDLMENFRRPYFSKSIQEFWTRWHISLSTWFRDYLYIPLGGNRVNESRIYMNVAIVFLLSGFWHGANWTFVVWGAIHFIYVFLQMKFFNRIKLQFSNSFLNRVLNILKVIFIFNIVAVAWIFFRANNMTDALYILRHIFEPGHIALSSFTFYRFGLYSFILSIVFTAFMFFVEYRTKSDLSDIGKNYRKDVLFVSLCLILIINFGVFDGRSFIYFQF